MKREGYMDIEYVKWGLANKFSDPEVIELNEALKTNQKLHDAILKHELGHKKENTFKQDLFHDLAPINKLSQKELIVFMIKHPRTLTQLIPFYWSPRRKQLIYDLNMIILYGIMVGFVAFGISLV